ncbi:MAG: WG repeat-containing protein [Gloeomargarita sp. SKYG98]|nr:WG repeat-containing protein [Gloeomargarita sp. SKYG98]
MVIAPPFRGEPFDPYDEEDQRPCEPFIDGVARVIRERTIRDKPEDVAVEFINPTGVYGIPPQFSYASNFSKGLAVKSRSREEGIHQFSRANSHCSPISPGRKTPQYS